jgi:hypothetical protein
MAHIPERDLMSPRATTETLAMTLRLSLEDFVETFGAGWQALPNGRSDLDAEPDEMQDTFGPWWVAGEPVQLAMRPRVDGVELGLPVGEWNGPHTLRWRVRDRRVICGTGPQLLDDAAVAVKDILRRRRSTFRYCRYCRQLTPSEGRLSADVCYSCGTEWQGVIY